MRPLPCRGVIGDFSGLAVFHVKQRIRDSIAA
jgi:hypothetical protein